MNFIWFRNDLRTLDNPAIFYAQKNKQPTIAVFYICLEQWQSHHLSLRKMNIIYQRLLGLTEELNELNIPLYIFNTPNYKDSVHHLLKLTKQSKSTDLFLNNEYEVDEIKRDASFINQSSSFLNTHQFDGNLFCHPDEIKTGQDTPFKVFSAFKNKIKPVIQYLPGCLAKPKSFPTVDLTLSLTDKNIDVTQLITDQPKPITEKQTIKTLRAFCKNKSEDYLEHRDTPSIRGTSELSVAFSIGIISVKQAFFRLLQEQPNTIWQSETGANTWLNELIWREFYRHTVFHFDYICKGKSLKPNYESIPFSQNKNVFKQWCNGTTGFPIVDAAMRQLNQTGWMHNRLRMISASFLIKDLHIDWRLGEQYFMQNLCDGDFASNNGGWQWCASTGFDSAPYFRVFNPTTQSKRFDARGNFIRKWIPELKDVPDKYIHEPHKFDELGLFSEKKINYPSPIVDHKQARLITLDLYKTALG
ncbi:deoxyribodipyrimidine photo-lyase [Marinicellulosiphila megalodicopiae]|uniref:deoxyribodipyrimidine photo-lyase n=1 Tax=Marinicellulosiphila megalodicopiae TaxID=2724896 RepID=UPI003BAF7F17